MQVTQELLDFLKNNLEIQIRLLHNNNNYYGEVSNGVTARVSILFDGVEIAQDADTVNF